MSDDRHGPPESAEDHEATLDLIRARRSLVWLIGLAFLPGMALVGMVEMLIGLTGSKLFTIVGLAWIAAAVVGGVWLMSVRCPRCFGPFFWGFHGPFASSCPHCDLPLNREQAVGK